VFKVRFVEPLYSFLVFIVVIIVVVVAPRRQGQNDQWSLISVSSLLESLHMLPCGVLWPTEWGVYSYKCRLGLSVSLVWVPCCGPQVIYYFCVVAADVGGA